MRVLVRFLAALAGFAVAVLGVLGVVELVTASVSPASMPVPWSGVRAALDGLAWSGLPVRIAAVTAIVLGLLLALLALRAGRTDIRLRDPAPEVTVTTDPRSLARLVGHRVREDEDVASARVAATRRRVRIKAVGTASSVAGLRPRLSESAEHTVQALPLLAQPRVSVSAAAAKEKR